MSLRHAALRGGAYLVARQTASLVIHLVGVLILTRTIGPASYGIYAAALGTYTILYSVCQSGVNVYLIRRPGEISARDTRQAFTLLLVLGAVGCTLAVLGAPLLERWSRLAGYAPVARALFAVLPLQLLTLVPSALLERRLDYPRVARCELTGQVLFYVVALPLAFRGAGSWAPVMGYWTQQLAVLLLVHRAAAHRPRPGWETALAREILVYGWSFSSVSWMWQLRDLVSPLVVGRYAGAAAVGYVALTARIVDSLSFVKTAAWRLSIAVLAPLRDEPRRLASAVSEGMRLQILTLGPILASFGVLAPVLVRTLYGERWALVAQLYPFIALSYLTNGIFSLYSSALCLVRATSRVLIFSLVHLALFFGSALVLVPRLGVMGYGWSEVAALPSYAVIHVYMTSVIGRPSYGLIALWWLGLVAALFWPQLGWWAALGPLVALAWPGTAREIRRYTIDVVGLIHAR